MSTEPITSESQSGVDQAPPPLARPVPLPPTWWSESTVRRILRWILGISQDVAAGEKFMRASLENASLVADALKKHTDRTNKMGDALNGVAQYAQDLERLIRFIGEGNPMIKQRINMWTELERQKREKQQAKVIASAGTEDVDQAAKSTEPEIVLFDRTKNGPPPDIRTN